MLHSYLFLLNDLPQNCLQCKGLFVTKITQFQKKKKSPHVDSAFKIMALLSPCLCWQTWSHLSGSPLTPWSYVHHHPPRPRSSLRFPRWIKWKQDKNVCAWGGFELFLSVSLERPRVYSTPLVLNSGHRTNRSHQQITSQGLVSIIHERIMYTLFP